MLEAIHLTCRREQRTLFDNLSFTINPGDVVQIEGANGAGKTTLLRMLTGLSRPDSGNIYWQQQLVAEHVAQLHRDLLYIGHQTGLKSSLTVLENLRFYHSKADDVTILSALDTVDLTGYEEVLVAQMSAGQQRRVALARLWLTASPLWILDEPLTALDKSGINQLVQKFLQHAKFGGIVILTTHQDLPTQQYPIRKLQLTSVEQQ